MKMIYPRNKNKFQKRPVLFVIAALVLGASLLLSPVRAFLRVAGENIAAPIWFGSKKLSQNLSSGSAYFSSKRSLSEENENLRARIAMLERDLLGYNLAVSENIDLKRMLGREGEGEIILAGVLGRSRDLPVDVLHVDAGEVRGVRVDALALAGFTDEHSTSQPTVHVAAGRVVEAFPKISKVELFSSVGVKTEIFLGPENIAVLIAGAGGGMFTAELPKDLDIRKGDTAALPGIEGYFVAVVEEVEVDISEAFQLVYLRTPFNPNELRYVGILQGE